MTNLLIFFVQGLTVGLKTHKKSEMIILERYDSCDGLMFRNKAQFHVRRFGQVLIGQPFLNGLGFISFKIKKMSTVLEFLWITGLAKMSTVWGSTVSA